MQVSAFLDDEACHAWSVSQLARQLEQLGHSYLLQQLPTSRSRHTPQHRQEHTNQLTQGASRNSSQCEEALLSTCSWSTNQSHTVCHDGLHAVPSLPRGRNHHCNCLEFLEYHASREHRLVHRQLGESACTHLDPRAACACKDLPSADSNVVDKTFGDVACGSVESDSCSWLWSQAGLCIGWEDVGSHGVCMHRVCQVCSLSHGHTAPLPPRPARACVRVYLALAMHQCHTLVSPVNDHYQLFRFAPTAKVQVPWIPGERAPSSSCSCN